MVLQTILFIVAILMGVFMAIAIGANDVANAMGATLGCKALSLRKILVIAAIFEFLGSTLLGGIVAQRISSGFINISEAASADPTWKKIEFMLAMISVLAGSSGWLMIATLASLPVSTTHSVVGAVVGVGIVMSGFASVNWKSLGQVALSWVASPLIGGIVAFLLWLVLSKAVIHAPNANKRMLIVTPFLFGFTIAVMCLFLVYQGLKVLHLNIPIYIAAPISIVIGAIATLIVWFVVLRFIKRQIVTESLEVAKSKSHELLSHEFLENKETNTPEIGTTIAETSDNHIVVTLSAIPSDTPTLEVATPEHQASSPMIFTDDASNESSEKEEVPLSVNDVEKFDPEVTEKQSFNFLVVRYIVFVLM
jgi:phosphate/sulfate permease